MTILWEFHPETDTWEGQETITSAGHNSYITNAYDYRDVADVGSFGYPYCYSYQRAAKVGTTKRFKGAFSISALPNLPNPPDNTAFCGLIGMGYSQVVNTDPWDFPIAVGVFIMYDGSLAFWGSDEHSTNTITAGTTYDLEVVWNDTPGSPSWRIYVDGDLWLEATDLWYPEYDTYPYIIFTDGFWFQQVFGWARPYDVTLHVGVNSGGEHVWTMEGPSGQPFWMVY